ncbi:MAG TPA: hypothetical protein VI318_13735 [Baekduia sp.]
MPTPPRLLAAVLTAGALAPAAAAHADDAPPAPALNAYRVTAEGTGTYERVNKNIHFGLGYEDHVAAAFSYRTVLAQVWFDRAGHLMSGADGDASGPAQPGSSFSGTASSHVVVHGMSGETPVDTVGDCVAPLQDVQTRAFGFQRAPGAQAADGEDVLVKPLSAIAFAADCTGGLAGERTISVWHDSDAAEGIMDQVFDLPQEATQHGKVIQLVSQREGQKAISRCPGFVVNETVSCAFSWKGTVTFDRIQRIEDGPAPEIDADDLPDVPARPSDGGSGAPAPGGTTTPAPPSAPAPKDAKASPAVTVSGTPRLDARRGRATVTVACAAACSGTVSAYAPGARTAKAAAKPLAVQRFTARAGRPTKVTVRLSAAARRRLHGRRTLTLVVAAAGARTTVVAR